MIQHDSSEVGFVKCRDALPLETHFHPQEKSRQAFEGSAEFLTQETPQIFCVKHLKYCGSISMSLQNLNNTTNQHTNDLTTEKKSGSLPTNFCEIFSSASLGFPWLRRACAHASIENAHESHHDTWDHGIICKQFHQLTKALIRKVFCVGLPREYYVYIYNYI